MFSQTNVFNWFVSGASHLHKRDKNQRQETDEDDVGGGDGSAVSHSGQRPVVASVRLTAPSAQLQNTNHSR